MLLDKKRKVAMATQKKKNKRALWQFLWMILIIPVVGGFTYLLFTNEILTAAYLYSTGIPRDVPEWALWGGTGLLIFLAIQLAFALGFLIASPAGRRKAGSASVDSNTADFTRENLDD